MTVALLDERIDYNMRSRLEDMGYKTHLVPACLRLPAATASHPDMLIAKIGRELITEKQYAKENPELFSSIKAMLPDLKITAADVELSSEYPCDCRLNMLVMGDTLYTREGSVSREALGSAAQMNMRCVSVRQGYPACTVLALGSSHAITADRGMAKALSAYGVEVLLIEDGGIELPPYDYGFIGGAAGVHGGKVFFLGDLHTHKNAPEIEHFCRAAGYEPISLGVGALLDLGRIIFIDSDGDND